MLPSSQKNEGFSILVYLVHEVCRQIIYSHPFCLYQSCTSQNLPREANPNRFPLILSLCPNHHAPPPPPKPPKPSRPIEKSNHTPHTSYGCSLISHIVSLKLQLSNILLFKLKHSKLATTILYPKSGKKINRFFSPM